VTIAVLANDTDPDGDVLRLDTFEQPQNGAATSETTSTILYTPAEGYAGTDSFTYTVVDDHGGAATATVSIVVRDPPPVSNDALLDRIAAAPEGTWLRVNTNRFEQVWTPQSQRARAKASGYDDPRRIISAWSSMAWDSNRRQLIIWGGGHGDYAGNDVYRFDAATLRWQRASLPSAVVAPFGDQRYYAVDGALNAPISSHTYDGQEFLPLLDRFITFGGAIFNTGGQFLKDDGVTRTGPYLWDPSRAGADMVGGTTGSHVDPQLHPEVLGGQMWTNRDSVVTNGLGATRPNSFLNMTSAYAAEPDGESLLVTEGPATGGDLFRYRIRSLDDPSQDEWQLIGPGNNSYSWLGAGAFDPVRNVYLRTAKLSNG